jgi:hypothetical protein
MARHYTPECFSCGSRGESFFGRVERQRCRAVSHCLLFVDRVVHVLSESNTKHWTDSLRDLVDVCFPSVNILGTASRKYRKRIEGRPKITINELTKRSLLEKREWNSHARERGRARWDVAGWLSVCKLIQQGEEVTRERIEANEIFRSDA